VFVCTNTLSATVIIGVEVFGPAEGAPLNDASATSLAVAPGAAVVFSEGGFAGISVDSILGGGIVLKGSARVLTTTSFKASQGVLCTTFFGDGVNDPPSLMTSLPVFRR
jgi:hypothetical protein